MIDIFISIIIISTISLHSINEKATIDYCISRRSAPDIEQGAGYVISSANVKIVDVAPVNGWTII